MHSFFAGIVVILFKFVSAASFLPVVAVALFSLAPGSPVAGTVLETALSGSFNWCLGQAAPVEWGHGHHSGIFIDGWKASGLVYHGQLSHSLQVPFSGRHDLGLILAEFKKIYLSLLLNFSQIFFMRWRCCPTLFSIIALYNLPRISVPRVGKFSSIMSVVILFVLLLHLVCPVPVSPASLLPLLPSLPLSSSFSLPPSSLLDKVCSIAQAGLKFLILLLWSSKFWVDGNVLPSPAASLFYLQLGMLSLFFSSFSFMQLKSDVY